MSTALEVFLARLYSSALETESFLRERAAYARAAGLPVEHLPDVLAIDAGTLRFAAQSFEHKRRSSKRDALNSEGVSPRTPCRDGSR
jgi:hypothetical protein